MNKTNPKMDIFVDKIAEGLKTTWPKVDIVRRDRFATRVVIRHPDYPKSNVVEIIVYPTYLTVDYSGKVKNTPNDLFAADFAGDKRRFESFEKPEEIKQVLTALKRKVRPAYKRGAENVEIKALKREQRKANQKAIVDSLNDVLSGDGFKVEAKTFGVEISRNNFNKIVTSTEAIELDIPVDKLASVLDILEAK